MAYEDYADYSSGSGPPSNADIAGLTANAATINGSTNYITDSGTTGSTGGVLNSSANPITTNSGPVDASGGNGSIPTGLQQIATQGLDDAVTSATEFGLGSLTDLLRVGAQGTTTAAAAPSPQGNTLTSSGIPTWAYIAAAVVIVAIVIHSSK
jgi:hypothetical protein